MAETGPPHQQTRWSRRLLPAPAGLVPPAGRAGTAASLLPAPAGLVPSSPAPSRACSTAPRTRGVGPSSSPGATIAGFCSPHPRGWSHGLLLRGGRQRLLPAPAGLVPSSPAGRTARPSAPRTRGVGPATSQRAMKSSSCSPHPRGWSQPVSPRRDPAVLLPAPAGLVPPRLPGPLVRRPAPRTRGVGPRLFIAAVLPDACSPHPRGWSRGDEEVSRGRGLLPAPAGLVPRSHCSASSASSAPRTRGVGPQADQSAMSAWICSPHPRGWSRLMAGQFEALDLLPAPAGLVPRSSPRASPPPAAPRTRGVGPTR